jgi:alpha-1,4-digalacturonate transport system substrate-binding protein
VALIAISTAQAATEIRVACYSDGNECEATQALLPKFEQDHPDIKVVIDKQAYKAILESLPVQLAGGHGPDIARTTDFGIISQYFLDLRPLLKDAAYWDANYGATLAWLRSDPEDKGIYGLPTQLTVSAPFVNKTLFDQANVAIRGPKATWDDWAKATRAVAKATQVPFAMAWDSSGHRFSGPAISEGAKYFAPTVRRRSLTIPSRRWHAGLSSGTRMAPCQRRCGAARAAAAIATPSRSSPTARSCST